MGVTKLSPVMQQCIDKVKECKILVRWSGGYWTRENMPARFVDEVPIPSLWHFNWSTVKALIDRGILVVAEENEDKDGNWYPVAVKLK